MSRLLDASSSRISSDAYLGRSQKHVAPRVSEFAFATYSSTRIACMHVLRNIENRREHWMMSQTFNPEVDSQRFGNSRNPFPLTKPLQWLMTELSVKLSHRLQHRYRFPLCLTIGFWFSRNKQKHTYAKKGTARRRMLAKCVLLLRDLQKRKLLMQKRTGKLRC